MGKFSLFLNLNLTLALFLCLGGLSACKKNGEGFTPFKKIKAKREARKNPYANNPYAESDAQQAAHGGEASSSGNTQASNSYSENQPPAEPDLGQDPRYDVIDNVEDRVSDAAKRHANSFNTNDGSFTSQARKREPSHVLGSTNPVDSSFNFSGIGNLNVGTNTNPKPYHLDMSSYAQRERVNRFISSGPKIDHNPPNPIRRGPPREAEASAFGLDVDYQFGPDQ